MAHQSDCILYTVHYRLGPGVRRGARAYRPAKPRQLAPADITSSPADPTVANRSSCWPWPAEWPRASSTPHPGPTGRNSGLTEKYHQLREYSGKNMG